MSDLLMQTIIEKLGQLETLIASKGTGMDNNVRLNEVKEECGLIKEQVTLMSQTVGIMPESMKRLSIRLDACTKALMAPVQQRVKHHHHLSYGLLLSVGMFIVVVFLSVWLYNTYSRFKDLTANDIKYRSMKFLPDRNFVGIIHSVDSIYSLDRNRFKDSIVKREQYLQKRLELLQMADEKEKGAKQLRGKARVK
ncbi:hypothetical protein [Chitinophaga sp. Ak27]|uniref:hypothetical protein n=1 Tax=Chitinophaga sp. Ak27 TaxID=2726116 RepID=UPI00145CFB33|nr:hypothetical protein [Chitinophaga sp. Ak27]NLU95555.1 hypothetical protein [Chitinophaga sp. Ak27]